MSTPDRKTVLLRATLALLQQWDEIGVTSDLACSTVHYDDADCDFSCLRDDIAHELEFPSDDPNTP